MIAPNSPATVRLKKRTTLDLVRELCNTLAAQEISYCHWKSNISLERSFSGENDLDLLVSRPDVQRFTEILHRLGFKQARNPSEQQLPGVLSYYGFDKEADKLVHVHAHFQLILGHDMTKNYRLPIEEPLLESAIHDDLLRIPSPEFELIVFVIRMVLKHSTWDAILSLQGTLSTTEQKEMQYLAARADQTQLYDILSQHLPFVEKALFSDCMRALRPGCPVWTRVKAGQQLQYKLRAHARRSQIHDVFLKLGRRGLRAVRRRIFRQLPKKRLASGGAIVALVGGDGAGKSTTVDELYAWLSKDFEVIKVHMGKPAWSWTTAVVRGILRIGRSLGLYSFARSQDGHRSDQGSHKFPGYPWLFREVCTARDRLLAYKKARRFASNGGLAICDRFPLPQVSSMDSLRSDLMNKDGNTNRVIEFMVQVGEKYYRQIMLPEVLIVLRVHPDIAIKRKVDEDAASVRGRSKEIWELDWLQTRAKVIDAERPLAEVISQAKALVWSEL